MVIRFGDPSPNIKKVVKVHRHGDDDPVIIEDDCEVWVDLRNDIMYVNNDVPKDIRERFTMLYYPITFSIPEQYIVVDTSTPKTKLLSDLIPGKMDTYIYNTQEDYFQEYRSSMFAITHKKGGWDCMRHYEIIANRCIPLFTDIGDCPPRTLALFPKLLVERGNRLYQRIVASGVSATISDEQQEEYNDIASRLLDYARRNLTTTAMASYVLSRSNHEAATSVLFLSGSLSPDYLRCVTLHGFRTLLGKECHDFPKVPHMYSSYQGVREDLYGRGYTYACLLDSHQRDDALDHTVQQDIRDQKYDIIVYGSYHRGLPFYDLVQVHYEPYRVIMLCGEENHMCDYHKVTGLGHYIFVREL